MQYSAAGRPGFDRNAEGPAANRSTAGAIDAGVTLLIEHRNVAQGVKVLPGNALWIDDPVFFTPGVTAACFAFINHLQLSVRGILPERVKFLFGIRLKAKVIQSCPGAPRGDREIHPWVLQDPFGVIGFRACGLDREES